MQRDESHRADGKEAAPVGAVARAEKPGWMHHPLARELDAHWIRVTMIAWTVVVVWFVWQRWAAIHWLSLGDTDDNMRLMQVRAWLAGQGWYDLRNYRLDPPAGFDIHWSRLVDLPIAALIVVLRPFVGVGEAERLACGIAPLLPLAVTMIGMGATVRRLVHPLAWMPAIAFLLASSAALAMFMPDRIDHHGWQIAMLGLAVAGLCDPRAGRGGAIVGLASAASLTIGLEMLPYAAMAGAITALRWVWDAGARDRLATYAATLGGGCAAGFAAFASEANRTLRCDALTPVWLSVMIGAGALLLALAALSPRARGTRLALAVLAGGLVVAGFALAFPQCLGRPEQVSDELYRNWLGNVREAKPIYQHAFRTGFPVATLPLIGIFGAIVATWRARRTAAALGWACVTLFAVFATAMLLWQLRAGPAAQLMAIPGVTALAFIVVPWLLDRPSPVVRILGTAGALVLISGSFAGLLVRWTPIAPQTPYQQRVNRASGRCVTLPALAPLDRLRAQTIFTFVDLGPRLIVATHHRAVAGPYHRNGAAILDVQHAFQRAPAEARRIMRAHGATLLLICPNMAESTNYKARAPKGFYARLAGGETFGWLAPVPLPRGSPLRAYRIN